MIQGDPLHNTYRIGSHQVSGIWQYFMPPELADLRFPEEKRAACGQCPKAQFENYRPDYKCCTYHPRVSNFSLGLAASRPAARKILEQLIAQGWLLPEGMISSPRLWYDYLADLKDDQFGLSNRVLCPFLKKETGLCQIYPYRNGVCSTFFCVSDHGERGEKFWESLQTLAIQNEMSLGQWCMHELGLDVEEYFAELDRNAKTIAGVSDEETRGWSEAIRKKLWKHWYGREMEFLEACGELVSKYREQLPMIADVTDILEANDFDKAMAVNAPKEVGYKIKKDEFEEGDTISPKDLYTRFKRRQKNLYALPTKPIQLNPVVIIKENPRDSKESKANGSKKYQITLPKRKNSKSAKDFRWQLYLNDTEFKLLSTFKKSRVINVEEFKKWKKAGISDPADFLARYLGLQALI